MRYLAIFALVSTMVACGTPEDAAERYAKFYRGCYEDCLAMCSSVEGSTVEHWGHSYAECRCSALEETE